MWWCLGWQMEKLVILYPSDNFSLLRFVLCLFFLKWCSSQVFISDLYFLSFGIPTYIANLHHQCFPFLKVTQKRDRFDPSYSWQIPVEHDPRSGRELGIWYLGLSKTVFYSSSVVLPVFIHKQTEKCYVTTLLPHFVLLTHLLFHVLWLLELLCISKGWWAASPPSLRILVVVFNELLRILFSCLYLLFSLALFVFTDLCLGNWDSFCQCYFWSTITEQRNIHE